MTLGRRGRTRSAAVGFSSLLVILGLLGSLAVNVRPSASAFSVATGNAGNQIAADTLAAPSGLSITGRCVMSAITPTYITSVFVPAGSTSFTIPATAAVNDALFAFVGSSSGYDGDMPAPLTGWSRLVYGYDGSIHRTYQVWQRIATSSDIGKVYAFSPSNAALVFVIRGGRLGASPTGVLAAASTTMSVPSAPGYAGGLLVGVSGLETSGGTNLTSSDPALFVRRTQNAGGGVAMALFTEELSSDGATGARTVTSSIAGNNAAISFVVRRNVLPYADLSWTASPTTISTGYAIERPTGTPFATVSGRTTTTWTDSALTAGSTYTYTVRASRGAWRSAAISGTVIARNDCYN